MRHVFVNIVANPQYIYASDIRAICERHASAMRVPKNDVG